MLTLEYAKDPYYVSEDGQAIHLTVKWEEFGEEHPFSATSYDSEAHGVDLYNRAKTGEFGVVQPYVAPPPVAAEPLKPIPPEFLAQLKQSLGL
jgi:hypothetical protein